MNTDARGYDTFTLDWHDRVVEVSFQANWLNTGYWHIELRCAEPLPVTTTGYRSYFVPTASLADQSEIKACVSACLNAAADTPAWRKHLEDTRQLKLF